MATAPKRSGHVDSLFGQIGLLGKPITVPATPNFIDMVKELNKPNSFGRRRGRFKFLTFPHTTTTATHVVGQKPEKQGGGMNTTRRPGNITNNINISLVTPSGVLGGRQTTVKEIDDGSGEGLDKDHNKVDGTENDDKREQDRIDDSFSCQPLSGQRRTYIEAHLGHLQKLCKQFYACTQELYSAENYHSILAGGMIQLKNFCGLLYANDGGQHTTLNTQCSSSEREAIRQKIGQELTKNLVTLPTDKTSTWHQLNSCVNANKTSNEEYIDTVCRLKKNTSHLCGDEHVNSATKVFFNHQLEQLHCSCVAIDPASSGRGRGRPFLPGAVKFGVAGGVVVLLLVLIIAVIILCLRHRKTKRKLRDHRMRYLPSAQETASDIYQEIHDEPRVPKLPNRQTQQGKLLPHGYELDVAPSLPARYVKGLNLNQGSNQRLPSDGDDRPHSYLEPLPEPLPEPSRKPSGGPANQGAPAARTAGDNPYSLAKPIEETSPTAVKAFGSDGTYFDTIQLARKRATEDDFGYSMLKRPLSHESTAERTSSSPEYFELEPQVEIVNDAEHSDKLNLRPESDSTADRMSSNPEYFQTEHQVENVNDAKHSDTIDGVVISSTKL